MLFAVHLLLYYDILFHFFTKYYKDKGLFKKHVENQLNFVELSLQY